MISRFGNEVSSEARRKFDKENAERTQRLIDKQKQLSDRKLFYHEESIADSNALHQYKEVYYNEIYAKISKVAKDKVLFLTSYGDALGSVYGLVMVSNRIIGELSTTPLVQKTFDDGFKPKS